MSQPMLERLFKAKLAELSLVASAGAGRIDGGEVARAKPTSKPPPPRENLVQEFTEAFEKAGSRDAKLAVVKAVQDKTLELKYSPARERVRGTLDWKLAIASDTRSSFVVGRAYGISSSYVRALRKAKRDGKLRAMK